MQLCSENHDEVCYEGRNCPCCIEIDCRKDAEKELEHRDVEIEKLKDMVYDLEHKEI